MDYIAIIEKDKEQLLELQKRLTNDKDLNIYNRPSPLLEYLRDLEIVATLPWESRKEDSSSNLFIAPYKDSRQQDAFLTNLYQVVPEQYPTALVLRYNTQKDELTAIKGTYIFSLDEDLEQKPSELGVLKMLILEKSGSIDLNEVSKEGRIAGIPLDFITQENRAALAHGKETEHLYPTQKEIEINNVVFNVSTMARIQIEKTSDLEPQVIIKPVYNTLEIPQIIKNDNNLLEKIQALDKQTDETSKGRFIEFKDPKSGTEILAFIDKDRNKVVLKKKVQFKNELILKPHGQEQRDLLLKLSSEQIKELQQLKSVKVNTNITDKDGNSKMVNTTLEPLVDFIRKELSFRYKTLAQDQNLVKDNKISDPEEDISPDANPKLKL